MTAANGPAPPPKARARRIGTIAPRVAAAVMVALSLWGLPARAEPAAERIAALRRGVNITGWFRYPASRDPAALRGWMSDAAMADLRRRGFSFVRLAIDPAILAGAANSARPANSAGPANSARPANLAGPGNLDGPATPGGPAMPDGPTSRPAPRPSLVPVLLDQVRRLQRQGLAVIVSPHPVAWDLDSNADDRARLVAFWRELAPLLRPLPAALTFPEVVNEPVFAGDPALWTRLQGTLRAVIRAALPDATIVLTGPDWGSIAGLLTLPPDPDGNVVYSFHYYDPAELTSLAAWRAGLDREALARLPFPVSDPGACQRAAHSARDPATRDLMRFYCAYGWDQARIRGRIEAAAGWARRNGVTLLAGEFGASAALNPAARLAWLRSVRETCEANGIGWALWGYDDLMGFGVRRPPENRPVLDRSVREALGLALPVRLGP